MIAPENRPLLTLGIVAYNQERYIGDAIHGAFSQTSTPLDIILSDDCSSDGTYERMRRMAESYEGPHRVVLNRNDCNKGIGAHVSHVLTLAQGELVVIGA